MIRDDIIRREFIAEARRIGGRHFQETASSYDQRYGRLEQTHLDCVAELLGMVESGSEILDAACGTGNYFAIIIESGRSVFGIDDSPEMLERARTKWPEVSTLRMALQDLRYAPTLRRRFNGLVCIDAMEWVLRDDWPIVLEGFRAVLAPRSPVYLTVELPGEHELTALDGQVPAGAMRGEIRVHNWYNYFPTRQEVLMWLSNEGFQITGERIGGGYLHLIVQSPDNPPG